MFFLWPHQNTIYLEHYGLTHVLALPTLSTVCFIFLRKIKNTMLGFLLQVNILFWIHFFLPDIQIFSNLFLIYAYFWVKWMYYKRSKKSDFWPLYPLSPLPAPSCFTVSNTCDTHYGLPPWCLRGSTIRCSAGSRWRHNRLRLWGRARAVFILFPWSNDRSYEHPISALGGFFGLQTQGEEGVRECIFFL